MSSNKFIPTVENKYGIHHILSQQTFLGFTEREIYFLYKLDVFHVKDEWLLWIYPSKEWIQLSNFTWTFEYKPPGLNKNIPLPPGFESKQGEEL